MVDSDELPGTGRALFLHLTHFKIPPCTTCELLLKAMTVISHQTHPSVEGSAPIRYLRS